MEHITKGIEGKFLEVLRWYKNLPEAEKKRIRDRANKPEPVAFVTFHITKKEWEGEYSKESYCHMGEDGNMVKVGTVMAKQNVQGSGALEMTPEEARYYDSWARGHNIRPFALTEEQ